MGSENELNKAFVSRMWTSSMPPLEYLLGGGTRYGAGVAVPLEYIDSGGDSAVFGRDSMAGRIDFGGGRGKSLPLMYEDV